MLMQIAELCKRWSGVTFLVLILTLVVPYAMAVQTPQALGSYDPLLDDTPDSTSSADLGGMGCFVATVTVGVGMLYLMGGLSATLASVPSLLPPRAVLEGSAALAFVLSSACYVGVTLAPLAVSTYDSILARFVQVPNRPLFAPGELEAIESGTAMPTTVPQQQHASNGQHVQ